MVLKIGVALINAQPEACKNGGGDIAILEIISGDYHVMASHAILATGAALMKKAYEQWPTHSISGSFFHKCFIERSFYIDLNFAN